jgi:formylglycine-generating enzyme required for sulfatase activity
MILIPIGASPDHPDLYVSHSEISFEDWAICAKHGQCRPVLDDHGWGKGRRPVINVSWQDAQLYAKWVSRQSGLTCRLPWEREWEAAARAGTATAFWWGDDPHANLANCRDCGPAPVYGSLPAGSFPANPWGLVDMNGNVWEWTQDCWSADRTGPVDRDLAACPQRVIKGGSWYYYSANARWDARARNDGRLGSYNIGIRLVCEPTASAPSAR